MDDAVRGPLAAAGGAEFWSTASGTGFGGRASVPVAAAASRGTFEIAVSVKLDHEEGAAGLVFCADGGDVHYGFYPSNGKLRFSRFDGPDVYSWAVLAEVKNATTIGPEIGTP